MMYLQAVDLNRLKSQAVCFSGEQSLNHGKEKKKKRNNWPTPASFDRGPGFDVGDKNLGERKKSDLSFFLSFAGLVYLILTQFSPGFKYHIKF